MAKKRKALIELLADDKRLRRGLRRASGRMNKFARASKRSLSKAFSGLKTLGGLGAGFGIAGLGAQVLDFEDNLQRVGSQARFTAGQVNTLRDSVTGMSDATGLSREKLLAGLNEVVDLQGGSAATAKNLDTMSTALLGTGAASEEVAGLMFALSENMAIGQEEMKGALSVIDRIGAEKSIPFKDLAAELAALTGKAKDFGVVGLEGTARLVASTQVLRTRFKGAAEVATGLAGAMTAFKKKEKDLKRMGVHIRTTTGEFKDLFTIIDLVTNSKKVQKKGLINVLGRSEATTAVQGISEMREEVERLAELGLANQNFLDIRAMERLESTPGKITQKMNRLKLTIAELFTPERLEKFADVLDKIVNLLDRMLANPGKTLAILAALKFGPGAVATGGGLALKGAGALASGGGSILGAGAGTAIKSAKGFGLVAAAGAAGFALGTFADNALGLSDGLSDLAVSLFGGKTNVKTGGANTVAGIDRQLSEGKINEGEAQKRKGNLAKAFEHRGINALVNAVGQSLVKSGSVSLGDAQKNAMGNTEITELARSIVQGQGQGKDMADEIRRLGEKIAGRPVQVTINERILAETVNNAINQRLK